MSSDNKQKNIEAIAAYLDNNSIDPNIIMDRKTKLEVGYYVGERRVFAEETKVGFNIVEEDEISVYLFEINDIEFETAFKVSEQNFIYDEVLETLNITGTDSKKHNEDYKLVINSIYFDFS